jgi:hypothetical protein
MHFPGNRKMEILVHPWIPFTSLNAVWRHIDPGSETILDVGCGKGEPFRFINRRIGILP